MSQRIRTGEESTAYTPPPLPWGPKPPTVLPAMRHSSMSGAPPRQAIPPPLPARFRSMTQWAIRGEAARTRIPPPKVGSKPPSGDPPVSVKPSRTASLPSPFSKMTTLARSSSSGESDMQMTVASGPPSDRSARAFPRKVSGEAIRYSPSATRTVSPGAAASSAFWISAISAGTRIIAPWDLPPEAVIATSTRSPFETGVPRSIAYQYHQRPGTGKESAAPGYLRGMFDRFTENARKAMDLASEGAKRSGHGSVRPEHLLWALIEGGRAFTAGRVLGALGADPKV